MPMIRPYDIRRCRFASFLLLAALALAPLALRRVRRRHKRHQRSNPPAQQPDQTSPDAGGPAGDNGADRSAEEEGQAGRAPATCARLSRSSRIPRERRTTRCASTFPEVTVDVGVLLEKTGQFVPGLKPSNFKVYENGVEQKVTGFKRVEAPITALMLCEFANSNFTYSFLYDMRNAAWSFAQQLRPQDYVALMTFDMRTQIWLDFTQDKRQLLNAIQSLVIPGFSGAKPLRRDL